MIRDALQTEEYDWLLEKDFEIYPTDQPVTREVLTQWYGNNPDFGIVFRENKAIKGVNITIPLNREGWFGLINGDLSEANCDQMYIFDNGRDSEIGLHVYHIRKFCDIKGFYEISLKALNDILENLRNKNHTLSVVGFSGLCVTKSGINLFYNKLNCRETAVIKTEHILSLKNKIIIRDIRSNDELQEKLANGYRYLNRCKMLVLYPEDPSIVWRYIKSG